jgi:hypothetical protein
MLLNGSPAPHTNVTQRLAASHRGVGIALIANLSRRSRPGSPVSAGLSRQEMGACGNGSNGCASADEKIRGLLKLSLEDITLLRNRVQRVDEALDAPHRTILLLLLLRPHCSMLRHLLPQPLRLFPQAGALLLGPIVLLLEQLLFLPAIPAVGCRLCQPAFVACSCSTPAERGWRGSSAFLAVQRLLTTCANHVHLDL